MKASRLVAGGALVALLLAGCGSDNSPSVSANSPGAATTEARSDGSSATTGGDSSSSGSTTTPSFTGDKNSEFCKVAKDLASGDVAESLSGDNPDLKTGLQKANDALDKAKNSAPSEIKQDVATLADQLKKYSDLLAQYDYDISKLTAAAQKDPKVLQQATDVLGNPNLEVANSRIVAYSEQVCGVTTSTS
jgi:hypothetical protein